MSDTAPAVPVEGSVAALKAGATAWDRFCRGAVRFWFRFMFFWARHSPTFMRWTRPFFLAVGWHSATRARQAVLANAAHILGPRSTPAQRTKLARAVLGNFYDFIYEIGRALKSDRAALAARIDGIEGKERYTAARAAGRGAILVTAHLGSFEVGAAVARDMERHVHVVFARDEMADFEHIRSGLRAKLGLIEAPVDDGWQVWVRLREALRRNEVVLMQADRVMPGQKGERVPFFDGHVLMPAAPAKLALAAGCPIIPVFAVRMPNRKVRVFIEAAVEVGSGADAVAEAVRQTAAMIERYVRAYPDQWLAGYRAWCEDQTEPAEPSPS